MSIFSDSHTQNLTYISDNFTHMGVDYVGHGCLTSQGKWSGYFSNKDWERIYIENQFYLHEPLTDILLKTLRPLFIWDLAYIEDNLDIMKKRYQICGIARGLSLTMKTNRGQEFLSLGFKSNHINCLKFFFQNKDSISNYFERFHREHLSYQNIDL